MIKSFPLFIFLILQVSIFPKVCYNSAANDSSGKKFIIATDTSAVRDSLVLLSKSKNIAKRDTIFPIYGSPISNNGYILSKDDLQKNDYRYTPDFFKLFEFSYSSETGNLGFPDKLYLYGLSPNQTNYLKDGIALNSNPYIFYDLNYLQSETVDSIEIIPAPRGFLYGNYNKGGSANFISKDFISISPYTRIKYYQGAFGEAMLDAIFNSILYKKLFGFLDITNRKLDQRFTNSDFSSWQVTARLRYLFSNSFNITGTYSYNKIYKALNGGVNVDTLQLIGTDINNYLYDEIAAPVVNRITDMDVNQHSFNLRFLVNPVTHAGTDINIYYKFDGQSLNNINDNSLNYQKTKNKMLGISFNQKYNEDIYSFNLIAGYEHSDFDFNFPLDSNTINGQNSYKLGALSLAGIAGINISGNIKASLFYKYASIQDELINNFKFNKESNGLGMDVNIKVIDGLFFYAGYSFLKDYFSNNYYGTGEVSALESTDNLYLKLSFFARNNPAYNYNDLSNLNYPNILLSDLQPSPALYDNQNVRGVGIKIRYKFWILSLESNSSFYSGEFGGNTSNTIGLTGIPAIYSKSGIYVTDSLFSANLNLKGGFVYTYFGKTKYITSSGSNLDNNSAYTIDFTLAGRIRNAATVYFTWENLLDEKYFLVPYYPALGRNLRFGIAWDLFN
jgi:outer membrane receptor protein involved in Fe transport